MLVTDAGKLIRSPVDDIRIAGRTTRGVTPFRIDDSERIVSVAHLAEEEAAEEGDAAAADADADADAGDDTGDGPTEAGRARRRRSQATRKRGTPEHDRKSDGKGKSVSERVYLGGHRS